MSVRRTTRTRPAAKPPARPARAAPPRASRPRHLSPFQAGLPDPRPLTDYTVLVETIGGNTVIKVTLDQPCVIHQPGWAFINVTTGGRVYAASVTALDNRTVRFQFAGVLAGSVAFIEVPYQDTQVRNFQGGFVRPGAQWFRKPV